MSAAPGWYPDPRGGGGRRYWDGVRWTDQVQQPGQYPQQYPQHPGAHAMRQQPYPQQPGPYGSPHPGAAPRPAGGRGGSTLALWITLAVCVALIIGLGSWLLFFRETSPQSTTGPEATVDPITMLAEGDVLTPLQCDGTADDARGEADSEGRYRSSTGLSFPAIPGFTAGPVQYPWVWGSNSQVKDYGNDWMASATVGTLEASEGFTSHDQAAVRLAQCMLGSEFYGDHLEQATVFAIETQPEDSVTWLDVDVDVTGVEGVGRDWVTVVTAERGDVLHVGVAVVPDSSEEDLELVQEAFADLVFS